MVRRGRGRVDFCGCWRLSRSASRTPRPACDGATASVRQAARRTEYGAESSCGIQTPLLLDRAAGLPDPTGAGLRAAIDDVVGERPLLVYVSRPDKVHQAVSFWRAVQTQIWRTPTTRKTDDIAVYHAGGIGHLLTILLEQDRGWRDWFAAEGITPLEVDYRDLASDSTAVVGKVLLELGLDPDAAPPPVIERQADIRSNAWVERYLNDAAGEGLPV